MKKFNIIKKSRKKSKGIDEKIEYLNKECQKTGLQEVMTTTNMYTVVQTVPAAPAEFDDVPDVDPVNGITSDNWTQPLGNDDNGNPASEPPTTFPRIWDNPGYSDPTDGLLNKNDLTGNGTALPIYKTDDLTWQDPSEVPAGAVGGMQIEVGGMDPGIVGGYLDSNGWQTTTGTHIRLGAPNFKTHPHLFKPVKYWHPFSIYHPYIDSYWPGGDKTPKYGGIVKGSLNGPKYALFTAYMYVGGGRNTYQTSPNTHSYPIVYQIDSLGDPLFLPIDIGRFGLSPQGYYWLKDRATDLAKKYKSEDDMWDAMADFLDKHNDPAEDPFSRKGTGMDDRWIGPPVDKAGYELEGQTLSEKSKSRHFKRKVKNEDVIDNTKFNVIKKSRKKSKGIDEKIEYLNKECQKTGLNEIMNTTGMYQGSTKVPNQRVADFQALDVNGFGLGLSPADGNGLGDAYLGAIESGMRHAGNDVGLQGVAISPPHPVTGQRQVAMTRTGGLASGGSFSPARPGVDQTGNGYPTGSIAWIWDPNFPQFGPNGLWRQIQTYPITGEWSFWDTNFLGFAYLNRNLDQMQFSDGSNLPSDIINVLDPLGIIATQQGGLGEPQTTVLVQNDLGDPGFLPINIPNLSKQAFDYLKEKAGVSITNNYYSPEDKKNVINYYKKLQADPNYQPKPYEKESLIKQMRAQGDGTQIASTDLSTAFPPSPPDKEPVDPPPETPDEPPAPPESNPYPDEKADPAGLDARALKLGYNDPYYPVNPTGHYIAMVTTAQDILSAEMEAEFYSAAARGESPNYDTASINQAKEKLKNARSNLDNWERWKKENNYIWKGPIDHAAEDQRRQAELEKQQRYETEKEKLEKAKEQAEADAEMHAAEAQKLLAEFGADVFLTLFGPGALKLAGKALGKLPAISKFFKLGKAAQKAQIDDALRAAKAAKVPKIMKAGKNLSADDVLDGFKNVDQNLYNLFKRNGPLSTSIDPIAGNMNKPGTVIRGRTGDILRIFDHKSGKFIKPDPIRLGASVELNKDNLLSEAVKNNTDIINSSKFKKYFK